MILASLIAAVLVIAAIHFAPWLYAKAKALRLPSVPVPKVGKLIAYPVPLWEVVLVGVVVLAPLMVTGRGCSVPGLPEISFVHRAADAVVYTIEKDKTAIPSGVSVALDKLNRQGIVATRDEVDATDGAGDVPGQYAVSRPAAKSAGLPSLVVLSGGKVLRVVKDPRTEAEVTGAAK